MNAVICIVKNGVHRFKQPVDWHSIARAVFPDSPKGRDMTHRLCFLRETLHGPDNCSSIPLTIVFGNTPRTGLTMQSR
ncbi:hypothetical protein [Nitrosomonas ureae]|uniref:Uncharacterized protein n=1 Tax=Nitrosomonas ureae TaxID=44577 RepID=A0A1H5WN93_9PROT|nr:hypothetical protein SAMN05216334_12010 [Nitrosomonas ureae]